jgi:hypothetical protein
LVIAIFSVAVMISVSTSALKGAGKEIAGQLSSFAALRESWPTLGMCLLLLIPLVLAGAVYLRYLVAVADLHGGTQLRKVVGAWRAGARDIKGKEFPRSIAVLGLVAGVVMSGVIGAVAWSAWHYTMSSTPLVSQYPVTSSLILAVMLGGLLVPLAEKTEAVRHTSQLIHVAYPNWPVLEPASRESLHCALCKGDVVPRSLAQRVASDSIRAMERLIRESPGAVARFARALRRIVRRDPLRVILLAALVLPAALGLSVAEYVKAIAVVLAIAVLVSTLVKGPGLLIFPFHDDPRAGSVMMRLFLALLMLVNCSLVLHAVEWGAELFAARGWPFDGNYAVLFILWTEVVVFLALRMFGDIVLRGQTPKRLRELLGRSVLPLATLLLAAVLAPWTATFTAFLLGLEFRRGEADDSAPRPLLST